MRAVVTGDLHFSLYGSDPVMENGLYERLYYIDKVFRESILKYAIDEVISNCIVAGDIFHNKSIIHSLAMATFVNIIRDFRQIQFYLIDGNHDMSKLSGDGVSALKALEEEENVTVIHDTLKIDNIQMVAWNNKMIQNIKKSKNFDYLISHFGLNDATLSSGISLKADMGMKDLQHFKYVILGHYHKPQKIEQGNTQLYYVGSPIQLNRGERNEVKRFLDVDFENNDIKSIETIGYKKYFQLVVDNDDDIGSIVSEAKNLIKSGHEVTLAVCGENVNTSEIPEEMRTIDKREVDITNRGVSLNMNEEDRLKTFLEIKGISEEESHEYMNVAREIVNEVKT